MNSPNVVVPMVNFAASSDFSRVTSGNLEEGKYYILRGGFIYRYDGDEGANVVFRGSYPSEEPLRIAKARIDADLQYSNVFPVFKPTIALPATNANTAFMSPYPASPYYAPPSHPPSPYYAPPSPYYAPPSHPPSPYYAPPSYPASPYPASPPTYANSSFIYSTNPSSPHYIMSSNELRGMNGLPPNNSFALPPPAMGGRRRKTQRRRRHRRRRRSTRKN